MDGWVPMATFEALTSLTSKEAETADAVFERLFPADERHPGAREIGVVAYLDLALGGAYQGHIQTYRSGLASLDSVSQQRFGCAFGKAVAADQDAVLGELERGEVAGWLAPSQGEFFQLLGSHLQEGLFADPAYGGNREKLGWQFLEHPGVWLENSAEENLSSVPVTKGGRIQSLADVAVEIALRSQEPPIPGFDPQRGAAPPAGE